MVRSGEAHGSPYWFAATSELIPRQDNDPIIHETTLLFAAHFRTLQQTPFDIEAFINEIISCREIAVLDLSGTAGD
jgi:hypothetical protein